MPATGSERGRTPVQLPLGELLVWLGFIDNRQLDSALAEQRKSGQRLGKILVERGIITEARLVRALARQFGLGICDPISSPVHDRVRALVPREAAYLHRVIPIAVKRGERSDVLFVATADPLNREMVAELERLTGFRIGLLLAGETEIELALARHYGAPPPPVVQRNRPPSLPPRPLGAGGGTGERRAAELLPPPGAAPKPPPRAPSTELFPASAPPAAPAFNVPDQPTQVDLLAPAEAPVIELPLASAARPERSSTAEPHRSTFDLLARSSEILPEATGSLPLPSPGDDGSLSGVVVVEAPVEATADDDERTQEVEPGIRVVPPLMSEANLGTPLPILSVIDPLAEPNPMAAAPPPLPPKAIDGPEASAASEVSHWVAILEAVARGESTSTEQTVWITRLFAQLLLDGALVSREELARLLERVRGPTLPPRPRS